VSQADIDVVLDQFAGVNERDFQRVMDRYAEDVVLLAGEEMGPQRGRYEGKGAVGEWFGDWFRLFGPDYRFEILEAEELEGGVIFVRASHGGRGRRSGVPVQGENSYLYRVRDGKVTKVGFFVERSEALEAASMPEWSGGQTD
jgi:ketosteroid isomerase-like protein